MNNVAGWLCLCVRHCAVLFAEMAPDDEQNIFIVVPPSWNAFLDLEDQGLSECIRRYHSSWPAGRTDLESELFKSLFKSQLNCVKIYLQIAQINLKKALCKMSICTTCLHHQSRHNHGCQLLLNSLIMLIAASWTWDRCAIEMCLKTRGVPWWVLLLRTGNSLGEDGCSSLKETMENMNMGDVLGSLRYSMGLC